MAGRLPPIDTSNIRQGPVTSVSPVSVETPSGSMSRRQSWRMENTDRPMTKDRGGLAFGSSPLGNIDVDGSHHRSPSAGSSSSVQLSPALGQPGPSNIAGGHRLDPLDDYTSYINPFENDQIRPSLQRFNSTDPSILSDAPSGSGSDMEVPILSAGFQNPQRKDIKGKSPEKHWNNSGGLYHGTHVSSNSPALMTDHLSTPMRKNSMLSAISTSGSGIDDAHHSPSSLYASTSSYSRHPPREIIVSDIGHSDGPQGLLRRTTFRQAAGVVLGKMGHRVANVAGVDDPGPGLKLRDERDVQSGSEEDDDGGNDERDRNRGTFSMKSPGIMMDDEKNPFEISKREGGSGGGGVGFGDDLEMDILPTLRKGLRGKSDSMREQALQGRSMWMFGPKHSLRVFCYTVLSNSYTESIILGLIVLHAVTLVIQSSTPLDSPRDTNGYFTIWEDGVLFGIFVMYTLEVLARIIVSGFLLDPRPDTFDMYRNGIATAHPPTQTEVLLSRVQSLSSRVLRAKSPNRSGARSPSPILHSSAQMRDDLHKSQAWRSKNRAREKGHRRKGTLGQEGSLLGELPFERALERQKGIVTSSRPFMRHSWHRLDLLAVVCFWVSFVLAMLHLESGPDLQIFIFRAVSTLRCARLLLITGGTATILRSLKAAGPLLLRVGFFGFFAIVLLAIIGVESFSGSWRRSCQFDDPFNSTNIISLGNQCGASIDPGTLQVVGFGFLDPKGYTCPIGTSCQAGPNPSGQSFDNIFISAVQVMVIASANNWSPLMYQLMDSDYFSSCLFAIAVLLILNFWLYNLIIAVVMSTFQSVRAADNRSAFGADQSLAAVVPTPATSPQNPFSSKIARLLERINIVWITCILGVVVSAAVKTNNSSQRELYILLNLQRGFTIALDIEIILRLWSSHPVRSFFSKTRNNIDLLLALISTIIVLPGIQGTVVSNWLSFFSFVRWYRVVLFIPFTRDFVRTLFRGGKGIANMIMMVIVTCLVATLFATQLFRGDFGTDDLISFDDFWDTFMGVWQVMSSENWTVPLYAAMTSELPFKQLVVSTVFFLFWLLGGYVVLLSLFVAAINENFQYDDALKKEHQQQEWAERDKPFVLHANFFERWNPYRFLPVAPRARETFTTAHSAEDRSDQEEIPANWLEIKIKSLFARLVRDPLATQHLANVGADSNAAATQKGLKALLERNPGIRPDLASEAVKVRRRIIREFALDHPTYDVSLFIWGPTSRFRQLCQSVVPSSYDDRIVGHRPNRIASFVFRSFVRLAVIASIAVACIATPLYRKGYYETHGMTRSAWFDLVEGAILLVFLVEAVIKIVADGLFFTPNAYLRSLWNAMDFLVLICLGVNTISSLAVIGGSSRFTRALTATRALRILTISPLRHTFYAVFLSGARNLASAAVLVLLYIFPFAVWGVTLWAGKLNRCNDPSASGSLDCVGEYLNTPIDASLGFLTPRVWDNPGMPVTGSHWSFDSIKDSMLILFEICSLEGWVDVMQSISSVTGYDTNISLNASPFNAVFAIAYNLVGSGIIMAVFLSLIILNYERRSGQALLTMPQHRRKTLFGYLKVQRPTRRPPAWTSSFRQWCAARASDKLGWWARAFTGLFMLHLLMLTFQDYSSNILSGSAVDWLFIALATLYLLDLTVGLLGLGWRTFLRNGWNIFYLLGVVGIFSTTMPLAISNLIDSRPSPILWQLQKLFIAAIPFNLVRRNDSLNQLFKTSVASLPAILELLGLWVVLFIVYAIMANQVFGLSKVGPDSFSRFTNFHSIGNSLVLLIICSTGEGWNGFMHDYARMIPPTCTDSDNYLESDCASAGWAYFVFISWNILSMYLLLNTFTAVVVQSFAYIHDGVGQSAKLSRSDIRAFKKAWSLYDPLGTGYIAKNDLVKLLRHLQSPFDVKVYPTAFSLGGLLSTCRPVQAAGTSPSHMFGPNAAIDVDLLIQKLREMDVKTIRARRKLFNLIYLEAREDEVKGRGIEFGSMLLLLAHHKLIDDDESLELDDLYARQEKLTKIDDLADLERVRSVFRGMFCRREYKAARAESKRTLAPEKAGGIPAIVLDPSNVNPAALSDDSHDSQGYGYEGGAPLWRRASISISEQGEGGYSDLDRRDGQFTHDVGHHDY